MNYEGSEPQIAVQELYKMSKEMVSSIFIDEFVIGFWPAFTGTIEDEEERHQILEGWINLVAGNANSPVRVLERDGTLIATIPPIISGGGGNNITKIYDRIREAKKMAKHDVPEIGKARLEATVMALKDDVQLGYLEEYVDDWVKLYERIEGQAPEEILGLEDDDHLDQRPSDDDMDWD